MTQNTNFTGRLMIYRDTNNNIQVDAILQNNDIWCNAAQFAELFQTSKQNISLHIFNIFASGELDANVVVNHSTWRYCW